jgi:hypothetical protein
MYNLNINMNTINVNTITTHISIAYPQYSEQEETPPSWFKLNKSLKREGKD